MRKSAARWLYWFLLPGIGIGLGQLSFAHTTGLSTSELKLGTNGLEAEIVFAITDLVRAMEHLDETNPTDANGDGKLGMEEITATSERVRKFAGSCLASEFDGKAAQPGQIRMGLDDKENFHVDLTYFGERPVRLRVRALLFAHLSPDHLHFISLLGDDGKAISNKMLSTVDDTFEVTLPGMNAPKVHRRISTFPDFLKLGVEHI